MKFSMKALSVLMALAMLLSVAILPVNAAANKDCRVTVEFEETDVTDVVRANVHLVTNHPIIQMLTVLAFEKAAIHPCDATGTEIQFDTMDEPVYSEKLGDLKNKINSYTKLGNLSSGVNPATVLYVEPGYNNGEYVSLQSQMVDCWGNEVEYQKYVKQAGYGEAYWNPDHPDYLYEDLGVIWTSMLYSKAPVGVKALDNEQDVFCLYFKLQPGYSFEDAELKIADFLPVGMINDNGSNVGFPNIYFTAKVNYKGEGKDATGKRPEGFETSNICKFAGAKDVQQPTNGSSFYGSYLAKEYDWIRFIGPEEPVYDNKVDVRTSATVAQKFVKDPSKIVSAGFIFSKANNPVNGAAVIDFAKAKADALEAVNAKSAFGATTTNNYTFAPVSKIQQDDANGVYRFTVVVKDISEAELPNWDLNSVGYIAIDEDGNGSIAANEIHFFSGVKTSNFTRLFNSLCGAHSIAPLA